MADRVLFISWGPPPPGREERSLEVFNDAVAYYGRMQQEGRIESFDVTFLAPNGDLNGYLELFGSAQQLADLQEQEEYQRILIAADLIVERLRVVAGFTGEEIARQMQLFQEAIAGVPQS